MQLANGMKIMFSLKSLTLTRLESIAIINLNVNMEGRMQLSEEVRKLSKELKVNLSEIARRTEQSPANLSKKLNKDTLSFEDFKKILEALGVTLECRFILPGEKELVENALDRRTSSMLAILEKELEVERIKNEYYESSKFAFRTAMNTLSGVIVLLENHGDDPKTVRRCTADVKSAFEQLMQTAYLGPDALEPEAQRAAPERRRTLSMGGKRVFVVDDNAINREIVTELLQDSGLEADSAGDGAQALESVKVRPEGYYDFILMDLQMPGMDGFETAKAVRALEGARSRVPIVAMTAGDFADDRKKAAEAGMNGFVQKPFDIQKLFGVLEDLNRKTEH